MGDVNDMQPEQVPRTHQCIANLDSQASGGLTLGDDVEVPIEALSLEDAEHAIIERVTEFARGLARPVRLNCSNPHGIFDGVVYPDGRLVIVNEHASSPWGVAVTSGAAASAPAPRRHVSLVSARVLAPLALLTAIGALVLGTRADDRPSATRPASTAPIGAGIDQVLNKVADAALAARAQRDEKRAGAKRRSDRATRRTPARKRAKPAVARSQVVSTPPVAPAAGPAATAAPPPPPAAAAPTSRGGGSSASAVCAEFIC